MASSTTTTRREPVVRRFDYRDLDRRDMAQIATAVVFGILLIWNLALTSSVNGKVKDVLAGVQAQQKNMDSLQQQVNDNEQKREGDMIVLKSLQGSKAAPSTKNNTQGSASAGNGTTGGAAGSMPLIPNTIPNDLGTSNGDTTR